MLANNSSIRNAAAILIIGIGAMGLQCPAQTVTAFDGATPAGLAPGSPAGSYPLSGFEHYDPFSGSLDVAVPLYHVGGRGEAGFDLVWNFAQTWVAAKRYGGSNPFIPIEPYPGGYPAEFPQSAGLEAAGAVYARTGTDFAPCGGAVNGAAATVTRIVFRRPDGTEIELIDQNTNGQPYTIQNPCSTFGGSVDAGRGTVFNSTDGGTLQFTSDAPIQEQINNSFGEADATVSGYLRFPNGVTYRIDGSNVSWIRDRNGNQTQLDYDQSHRVPVSWYLTVFAASQITDSLGRKITINYGDSSCEGCTSISYPGGVVKVNLANLSAGLLRPGYSIEQLNQLFPQGSPALTDNFDPVLASNIQLPDGRQYSFLYNSYGEIARITLPTGGYYEYDYGDGNNGSGNGFQGVTGDNSPVMIYRRLQERREYALGGGNFTSKTHYTVAYPGSSTTDTETTYDTDGTTVVAQTDVMVWTLPGG